MTPREAAIDSIRRMKTAWPAWSWATEMEAEYGRALMDVADPEAVVAGTTRAIREVTGKYPPPIADLLVLVRQCRAVSTADTASERASTRGLSVDEGALRDAIAALDYAQGEENKAFAEDQISALRKRLPDFGTAVDQEVGVRYVRGMNRRDDPPETIRLRVLRPEVADDFPRGPLNGRDS